MVIRFADDAAASFVLNMNVACVGIDLPQRRSLQRSPAKCLNCGLLVTK